MKTRLDIPGRAAEVPFRIATLSRLTPRVQTAARLDCAAILANAASCYLPAKTDGAQPIRHVSAAIVGAWSRITSVRVERARHPRLVNAAWQYAAIDGNPAGLPVCWLMRAFIVPPPISSDRRERAAWGAFERFERAAA